MIILCLSMGLFVGSVVLFCNIVFGEYPLKPSRTLREVLGGFIIGVIMCWLAIELVKSN